MKRTKKKVGKVVKTYQLLLNVEELIHLRDLFSVHLPPDMTQTVSQFLANAEKRSLHEARLWNKISKLCEQSGVALEDEAPDYVIAPTGPTPMGVYRLQLTEDEENAQQEQTTSIFDQEPNEPEPKAEKKKKPARKRA